MTSRYIFNDYRLDNHSFPFLVYNHPKNKSPNIAPIEKNAISVFIVSSPVKFPLMITNVYTIDLKTIV